MMHSEFLSLLSGGDNLIGIILGGAIAFVLSVRFVDFLYKIGYRSRLQEAQLLILIKIMQKETYSQKEIDLLIKNTVGQGLSTVNIKEQLKQYLKTQTK